MKKKKIVSIKVLQNQDDEDDIEYSEVESNNPDADNEQNDEVEGDGEEVVTRTMPNENTTDTATSRDARLDDTQNTSDNHHMKNSPSDEEFYGGPTTGLF